MKRHDFFCMIHGLIKVTVEASLKKFCSIKNHFFLFIYELYSSISAMQVFLNHRHLKQKYQINIFIHSCLTSNWKKRPSTTSRTWAPSSSSILSPRYRTVSTIPSSFLLNESALFNSTSWFIWNTLYAMSNVVTITRNISASGLLFLAFIDSRIPIFLARNISNKHFTKRI